MLVLPKGKFESVGHALTAFCLEPPPFHILVTGHRGLSELKP